MSKQTIVKMIFGSHLYGLDTPESDTDYKGVYLPDYRDALLQRVKKSITKSTGDNNSRNTRDDVDVEMYSLHYFIELACQGQTSAIDMLHAPDCMIVENSEIWKSIVENRSRFYTSNLSAFVGYCRRQASKYGMKGSRLNSVDVVISAVKKESPESRLKSIWEELPSGEHIHKLPPNPKDVLNQRIYQVVGKLFTENAPLSSMIESLNRFKSEYGGRAKQAAKNEGIDWKAVSHAIRAATQVIDIYTKGSLIFPLHNSDYIKSVKAGNLDYKSNVGPMIEKLMLEAEELAKRSDLPKAVDRVWWDTWLYETLDGNYQLRKGR